MTKTKVCSTCGVPKPLSFFWRNANAPDGFMPRCMACCKAARGKPATRLYRVSQ